MNFKFDLDYVFHLLNEYFLYLKRQDDILKENKIFNEICNYNYLNYKEIIDTEEYIQKGLTIYFPNSIREDRLKLYYEYIPNVKQVYNDLQESLKSKLSYDPYYSNYLEKGHVSKYNFNECLLLVDDLRAFVEEQYVDYFKINKKLDPVLKPIYMYRETLLKQILDEHTKNQLLYMDYFIKKYPGDSLTKLYKEKIIQPREKICELLENREKFYYLETDLSDKYKKELNIKDFIFMNKIFNDPILNRYYEISYGENRKISTPLTTIEKIELTHEIIYYRNTQLLRRLPWQQPTIIKNKYKINDK